MTTTYTGAVEDINKLFLDGWTAGAAAIVGYVPKIVWVGKQELKPQPSDKYWARVMVVSVSSEQTAMGVGTNHNGVQRYTDYGFVMVELFHPKTEPTAWESGEKLAEMARNIFRGKQTPGGVWFRNLRINPITPLENFYRHHVVADYEYDEVQ